MSTSPKDSLQSTLASLSTRLEGLRRYRFLIFICLVIGLYGFVVWRIHTLNTQEPSSDAVSTQVKAVQIPHIDQQVVKQLQSLQDNSVSVHALFDQARNNPFQ